MLVDFKRHFVPRNCTEWRRFVVIVKPLPESFPRSGNMIDSSAVLLLTELSEFGVTHNGDSTPF
jgi:hypothetical protein